MTFAQFRKMKPKYQIRIAGAVLVAFLLVCALIFGLSAGIRLLSSKLRTTELTGFSAATVLRKEGYQEILNVLKQEDAGQVLVLDSEVVTTDKGAVTKLTVNLLNMTGVTTSDLWVLEGEGTKVTLRRLTSDNENRSTMALRKATFRDYFPALSRISSLELTSWLQSNAPVGEGGLYRYIDDFDNNLEPQFVTKLPMEAQALWISKTGTLSTVNSSFTPVSICAPMEVYATPVNADKTTEKRLVLQEELKITVAMFEAGYYM